MRNWGVAKSHFLFRGVVYLNLSISVYFLQFLSLEACHKTKFIHSSFGVIGHGVSHLVTGWSNLLVFSGFGSSLGAPRAPFLNFSKICVFAPVTDFRRFSFFSNRRNLTFFVKNLHKVLCRVFFWLAQGPRYCRGACPNVS